MDFAEFLKTLSDMELVAMQKEARQVGDKETLNAVLIELGRRQKEASKSAQDNATKD